MTETPAEVSRVFVLFGATGDLARRKLLPALHGLGRSGLLPPGFRLVGVAKDALGDDEFRETVRGALREFAGDSDPAEWVEQATYVAGTFDDPGTFARLTATLAEAGPALFYLATPPAVFGPVAEQLARAGLARHARLVVEKPFGHDLASARHLNAALLRVFDERQLFRIDHYLGKETVQNLLVFRFANLIWESIWNRAHVDHVEITVAETVGVEGRAGYYERAGAVRDMIQSHLLQLLALVGMEPPGKYDADSIRTEKVKVLGAARCAGPQDLVRGQYAGYRAEPGVAPDSITETFAALRVWVDNWRWAGVPFYLRTGKRLAKRASEIAIHFQLAPDPITDLVERDAPAPNLLLLRIQPDEGISLFFEAKVPGLAGPLRPVQMSFDYKGTFEQPSPEAYQRLLLDAMEGDATLFARADEVEAAWALVAPVLDLDQEPEMYPIDGWGPAGADQLLAADGKQWHRP